MANSWLLADHQSRTDGRITGAAGHHAGVAHQYSGLRAFRNMRYQGTARARLTRRTVVNSCRLNIPCVSPDTTHCYFRTVYERLSYGKRQKDISSTCSPIPNTPTIAWAASNGLCARHLLSCCKHGALTRALRAPSACPWPLLWLGCCHSELDSRTIRRDICAGWTI